MAAPYEFDTAALRRQLTTQLSKLAADVDSTRADEGFRTYMRTMAAFWRYSPFNQLLIRLQHPDAVRVAGQRTWESLGRTVRSGACPIMVLAPPCRSRGFWAVPVYDLHQTEGAPLPTIDTNLQGESRLVPTLVRAAANLEVEVDFVIQAAGLAGTSHGGRIEVDPCQATGQQVRVLAHELAHEVLHQAERAQAAARRRPPPSRSHAEVETEADATAYVVLLALGLEAPSPAYIAWRGGTGTQVLRSMTRIQRAARTILEACATGPVRRARRRGHQLRAHELAPAFLERAHDDSTTPQLHG
jgi:hypothetical protein